MSIVKKYFDTYNGREVSSYTMSNKNGMSVTVLDFGGTINKLIVPDKNGVFSDVICGFENVGDYIADASNYSGALVGRYANRLAGGGFKLNGVFYKLDNNDSGVCHLHGGKIGFSRRMWEADIHEDVLYDSVSMSLVSPDGEDGYPANVSVKVTYTLDSKNALEIHYEATADKDTILNLTSHGYYNLSGYDGDNVLEHQLMISSDRYDEPDRFNIPLGMPISVSDTRFDFRKMKKIEEPLDHNFILSTADITSPAAMLCDNKSGRTLTLYTNYPAIQIYTAEFMNGRTMFKGGVAQRPFHAICLETQYSPNTPNRDYMPSCVLKKGEKYDKTAKFVFGTV